MSALVEIKRDNRKVQNIKRISLLKKFNKEKKENLYQVTEELKQKVSARTQQLSRYKKRQNQFYQNKLFRTDCKKFYNCLRHTHTHTHIYEGMSISIRTGVIIFYGLAVLFSACAC